MNREEAIKQIRSSWRQILPTMTGQARQRVNGEKSYICPICGHGEHGDGLTYNPRSKDRNGLKCFSCEFAGDIIDLYQKTTGADFNTALSLLASETGINIDTHEDADAFARELGFFDNKPQNKPNKPQNENKGIDVPSKPKAAQMGAEMGEKRKIDYTAYYEACRQWLIEPAAVAYLESRGISRKTAESCMIGFDPAADPANAPGQMDGNNKKHPAPRIIIPTSKDHYIARSIDPDPENKFKKLNPQGGSVGIFNVGALYAQDVQEVFVTEGAFDALSILEAGYNAIAINSASNVRKLLEQLEQKPTEATLIICLDNDKRGQDAAKELHIGLQRLNQTNVKADICGGCKDPNEALTKNRNAFADALAEARYKIAARPDNTKHYIDVLMSGEISKFRQDKKTGFANLDKEAGGLYTGLYVLAAISSLGKTTFALQIADNLAEAGNDVIFFSLEQSRLELVSKSIARRTVEREKSGKLCFRSAVSSLSIRKGYLPERVLEAAEEYKAKVGDRISIVEGNFKCNVSFIGEYLRRYIHQNDTQPVVIIDYLQILQPAEEVQRKSTKEAVDNTITELKRLSRELDLTVIAISSVNRTNYLTPIDFESLKESGGIEYSCDVLWGLQLQCLNEALFSEEKKAKEKRARVKEAKSETPRKIELSCLKNRYGKPNFSCYFNYYPANDLYVEDVAVSPNAVGFLPWEDSTQWENL